MTSRLSLIIVCLIMGAAAGFAGASAFLSPAPAPALQDIAPFDLTVVDSAFGAGETIDRLVAVMERRGVTIFARIDHGAAAAAIDQPIPPSELLIFGNPNLGTPLIANRPMAAFDLPMKMLVWENQAGETRLAYLTPSALAARHEFDDHAEIIGRMADALAGLAAAAAQ